MPIAPDLLGKYENTIHGMMRRLEIKTQDTQAQTISGVWHSSINGVAVDFPVSGFYLVPASNTSSALFFSVQGHAEIRSTSSNPPVQRAAEAVVGYSEISGPLITQLFITDAWAEDNPNQSKETSAWTPLFLVRVP